MQLGVKGTSYRNLTKMSFPTQWKVGETEKKVVIFCNRKVAKIWKSSRLGRSGVSPISCHKLNTHPDILIKLFIHRKGAKKGVGKMKLSPFCNPSKYIGRMYGIQLGFTHP